MIKSIEELNLIVHYVTSNEIDLLIESNQLYDVVLISPNVNQSDKLLPYKYGEKDNEYLDGMYDWIDEGYRHLNKYGTILLYNLPRLLPYCAEHLHSLMTFKYWISIKNPSFYSDDFVNPFHEGVLLFVKNSKKFTINKVRYPHIFCNQCGDFLADWGGKKHLRPKYGPVISDVWDDRDDFIDEMHGLSEITINRLFKLTCKEDFRVLIAMYDGEPYKGTQLLNEEVIEYSATNLPIDKSLPSKNIERFISIPKNQVLSKFHKDEIFIGDSIDILSSWISDPRARFDLIFADPPYNLEKDYGNMADDLKDQDYVNWCDTWLDLCTKLLKPYGTLYVLNLPKWSYFHATLLSKRLWFQRWIVWDALSDPRGKVMPAHYGLLMYTNHPTIFTYNEIPHIPRMDLCLRANCIKKRPEDIPQEELSDIWYDIHRIKHKRDRDAHPCQLPVKLLERVIRISSKPGDLVLDPFLGTGTSAIMSKSLGRHYAGIDIDSQYREISLQKLNNIYMNETNLSSDSTQSPPPIQLQFFD